LAYTIKYTLGITKHIVFDISTINSIVR